MSIFRNSGIASFTRGGQTTLHYIRMIAQVITQFMRYILFSLVLLVVGIFWIKSDPFQREIAAKWVYSYVSYEKLKIEKTSVIIEVANGHKQKIKAVTFLNNSRVKATVDQVYSDFIFSLIASIITGFFLILFVSRFILRAGKVQGKDEFVRGGKLVEAQELNAVVNKELGKGIITIGGVTIPQYSEPAHMLFNGGPGTGKSVLYKSALRSIRKHKQRAIVYDISGDFVQAFYREGKDIILNPLDARCPLWNIWLDANHDWDYDSIAASLIPDRALGSDPIWAMAARYVFIEIAKKLAQTPNPTNEKLLELTLKVTKEEIIEFLKDTDASVILDKDSEKMLANIRTMLATYIKPLRYLPSSGDPFSIREWIQNESEDSWVFITSTVEQKEALKPLITIWIDIASASILSLKPKQDRRIWMVIDELPTLNKVNSLLNTLTNSRKYGGCMILGYQSYPQLIDIYGKNNADAVCEACSTWVILRANGSDTAEWASKGLGMTEIKETNESLSYGAHEMRDGVSLARERKLRPIVLATEINNLPDLEAYLKLGRNFPLSKIKIKYEQYPTLSEGFIYRNSTINPSNISQSEPQNELIVDVENDEPPHITEAESQSQDKVKFTEIGL